MILDVFQLFPANLCPNRAAQKREHHRRWRSRRLRDEVDALCGDRGGEGPSGAGLEDDLENFEQFREDFGVREHEAVENGAGVSSVADSRAESAVSGPTVESAGPNIEDTEGDRVTLRNRKCSWGASKVINTLMEVLDAGFSEEEKRSVLERCFCDERIRALHPELCGAVQKVRTVEPMLGQSLKGALQTIRSASIQGKSKVRNIVLTAAVSKGDSQRKICKALGASRYLVRKAFQRRAEVDETGENLWAGGDRKRRSDCLSAEDRSAVSGWWETETTVSPNKKDVKRRRIGVKDYETHATHYLQVLQVNHA